MNGASWLKLACGLAWPATALALEAKWTPAGDGPARFSKRHRDQAGIGAHRPAHPSLDRHSRCWLDVVWQTTRGGQTTGEPTPAGSPAVCYPRAHSGGSSWPEWETLGPRAKSPAKTARILPITHGLAPFEHAPGAKPSPQGRQASARANSRVCSGPTCQLARHRRRRVLHTGYGARGRRHLGPSAAQGRSWIRCRRSAARLGDEGRRRRSWPGTSVGPPARSGGGWLAGGAREAGGFPAPVRQPGQEGVALMFKICRKELHLP